MKYDWSFKNDILTLALLAVGWLTVNCRDDHLLCLSHQELRLFSVNFGWLVNQLHCRCTGLGITKIYNKQFAWLWWSCDDQFCCKMKVNGPGMFKIGTNLHKSNNVCVPLCRYCSWWLVFRWCCRCVIVCCSIKFMNFSVSVNIIVGMYTRFCGWRCVICSW